MSLSDPIGDMLARIKNAYRALLLNVEMPYSSHKIQILDVLKEEGYITGYTVEDVRPGVKMIDVELRYSRSGRPALEVLQRVSKPSRRVYSSYKHLRQFFNGMGVHILSTSSHGVVSDKVVRKLKLGGEVICRVF